MEVYQHGIPAGYQRVEYIETNGSYYIDTGIILTPASKIQMDFQFTIINPSIQYLFCSPIDNATDDTSSNAIFAQKDFFVRNFYGDSNTISSPAPTTSRMTLEVNGENLTIGNSTITSTIPSTFDGTFMNCFLLGRATYSNGVLSKVSNTAYIKLYSCKIWDEKELVRNFVPCCIRGSIEQAGLFDTITQTFFKGRNYYSREETPECFEFVKPKSNIKTYINVRKRVKDYGEGKIYLSKATFPLFFNSTQGDYLWEIKNDNENQNSVIIEPIGSYGQTPMTEKNNYLELTATRDLGDIEITLFSFTVYNNTETRIYFQYNLKNGNIVGIYDEGSKGKKDNLPDVKSGDKLKFWYKKQTSIENEQVCFKLTFSNPISVKIETGTSHVEESNQRIKKFYISKDLVSKECHSGYIGRNNISKSFHRSLYNLSELPIGALLSVLVENDWQSRFGREITFKIVDKNHIYYPSNSITLATEKLIQCMAFDEQEPQSSNTGIKNGGNNRYVYSNIHQWLNSNATAGNWYKAQHNTDAPPDKTATNVFKNPYVSWAGFLAMLDPIFVEKLMDTVIPSRIRILHSSLYGSSEEVVLESFRAKMFLASLTEVGLGELESIKEGAPFALFNDDASRIAYPTKKCAYYAPNYSSAEPLLWLLRTPLWSTYDGIEAVNKKGSRFSNSSYVECNNSYNGIRPFCNISGSTLVEQQLNGTYTLA